MVEHPNQSHPKPGSRADRIPYRTNENTYNLNESHLVPLLRRVVQRGVLQLVPVVDHPGDLLVVGGRLGGPHEEVEARPVVRQGVLVVQGGPLQDPVQG